MEYVFSFVLLTGIVYKVFLNKDTKSIVDTKPSQEVLFGIPLVELETQSNEVIDVMNEVKIKQTEDTKPPVPPSKVVYDPITDTYEREFKSLFVELKQELLPSHNLKKHQVIQSKSKTDAVEVPKHEFKVPEYKKIFDNKSYTDKKPISLKKTLTTKEVINKLREKHKDKLVVKTVFVGHNTVSITKITDITPYIVLITANIKGNIIDVSNQVQTCPYEVLHTYPTGYTTKFSIISEFRVNLDVYFVT